MPNYSRSLFQGITNIRQVGRLIPATILFHQQVIYLYTIFAGAFWHWYTNTILDSPGQRKYRLLSSEHPNNHLNLNLFRVFTPCKTVRPAVHRRVLELVPLFNRRMTELEYMFFFHDGRKIHYFFNKINWQSCRITIGSTFNFFAGRFKGV